MISVQHLNKSYGEQHVLKDMSFDIPSGSVVGFLGPNGAGKSTTMKIITGYLEADSGNVWIDNEKVATNNVSIRHKIGYLPEHNPLYKDMYIKEYLYYVAGIYRIQNVKQEVERVIAQTGLNKEQHKKINQLSKGYRQRVGIAQAIIHNPEILILDEPTSGLDPNQIVDIRNLIIELGKEKTVMLSTHIMQEVEAMCQRVLIVGDGNIVRDAEISHGKYENTQNKTFRVVFNTTIEPHTLEEDEHVKSVISQANNSFLLQLSDQIPASYIFDFAVKNAIKISHLSEVEENLEALFRSVTRK